MPSATLSNPYETTSSCGYGAKFDVVGFANDLCQKLDGIMNASDADWYRTFTVTGMGLPHPLQIWVGRPNRNSIGQWRVELSAAPVREVADVVRSRYGSERFPSITVDSGRPLDALVADIQRRLVTPSAAPLVKAYELATQAGEQRSAMQVEVAALTAAFPKVQVTLAGNGESATIYFNDNGAYLTGDLYADGHIAIQRVSVKDKAMSRRLLSALTYVESTP